MPQDPKDPRETKSEKHDDHVAFTYVAKQGEYLHGVPARDLTATDVGALDDVTQQALEASGLYVKGGK